MSISNSKSIPVSDATVNVMGVPIHGFTTSQFLEAMFHAIEADQGGWVVTINLDILRRIVREPIFAQLVQNATFRVADGMPLVWGSRLKGTPLPERLAGSSLVVPICHEAARRDRSVFLLGGAPGTADRAAEVLQRDVSGLRIAGTHCPPMGFEGISEEREKIVSKLGEANPDIVFVALGSPKQEILIAELRERFPLVWWLGVGISFSFLAGEVRRAPRWVQRLGLEWFHRLVQEPKRLGKRYLVDGLPFAIRLFAQSIRERRIPSADRTANAEC